MKKSFKIIPLLCTLIFSTPSWATVEDSQIWTSLTASTSIAPKFDIAVELHARFTEDNETLGQKIIRPSITYKLNDRLSFSGGYFYGLSNSSSSVSHYEQRLWQQIGYILYENPSIALSGRTRLEERFAEDESDTGYRLRQQIRLQAPLMTDYALKGVVWNETFFGLNETSWGQRDDIDQTRSFIGVSFPLTEQISVEPGYLNQLVFNDAENRLNHILSVGFNLKF